MSLEQTPIVFTSVQNQANPLQYTPLGMALLSGGLVQIVSINGVGLVTNGLVWQANSVWFDPGSMDGIATGWTACAGYSGSAMASLIITNWSSSQSFGNEFVE